MSSRDLRKVLIYVMNLLAFGSLHLSGEIPAVVLGLFYAGFIVSWFWEESRIPFMRVSWPWTTLTIGVFVFSLVDIFWFKEFPLISAMNFVLFLQTSKLFQRLEHKDYMQSMALSLLVLTAGAALNDNLNYGFIFGAYVFVSTLALVVHHMCEDADRHSLEGGRALRLERPVFVATSGLAALIFLGSVVVFFTFPRIGFGMFAHQGRKGVTNNGSAGFGEEISLGNGGEIAGNDQIVMRVNTLGDKDLDQEWIWHTHWRGNSLDLYDGRTWHDTDNGPLGVTRFDDGYAIGEAESWNQVAAGTRQTEIYLEPTGSRVMFSPGFVRGIQLTLNSADIPDTITLGRTVRADTTGTVIFDSPRKSFGVKYTALFNDTRPDEDTLRNARWGGVAPDLGTLVWAMDAYLHSDQSARLAHTSRNLEAASVFVAQWIQGVPPGSLLPVDDDTLARLVSADLESDEFMLPSARVLYPPGRWLSMARRYLQLPKGIITPRMEHLARTLRAQNPNAYDYAKAVASTLKRLQYTTNLPTPDSDKDNVIDRFLFDWRRGHCEYFASTMTILLREQGIPARVANGYLGGAKNSVGDYFVVRQNDAHSWVEAYFPGQGWITFDPSPAEAAPPPPTGFSAQVSEFVDTMRLAWFKWIVEYDVEKQASLVRDAVSKASGSREPLAVNKMAELLLQTVRGFAARMRAGGIVLLAAAVAIRLFFVRARRRLAWKTPDWLIGAGWLLTTGALVPTLWPGTPTPLAWGLAVVPPIAGTALAWWVRRALLDTSEGPRRPQRAASAAVSKLYVDFVRKVETFLGPQPVGLTVAELRNALAEASPAARAEIDAFLTRYEATRFGDGTLTPAELRRVRRQLDTLAKRLKQEWRERERARARTSRVSSAVPSGSPG